jgi:hypothetical protein
LQRSKKTTKHRPPKKKENINPDRIFFLLEKRRFSLKNGAQKENKLENSIFQNFSKQQ